MYIVTQFCFGTDTGTGAAVDDTDLQVMRSLGGELFEDYSVWQTEENVGQLAVLSSEPKHCFKLPTDATVTLFEQAVSNPKYIWVQLMELASELAEECHHSSPPNKWDPKHPKAKSTRSKLQAQVVADVNVGVSCVVLI